MRKIYIPALLLCVGFSANAQKVTYNHDDAKMNQITVQEIGSGSLTPSLYYTLLHNNYRKSAAAKNKMSFRSLAGIASYQQIDDAEALDSAFIKRAEIEALNMVDRQVDLAWLAEGSKLQAQLQNYQRNIQRILSVGGRAAHQRLWIEKYNIFTTAIKAIRQAYMPNSQRKKEYLRIYKDIVETNENLLHYIIQLNGQGQTARYLAASYTKPNRNAEIATAAMNRWRNASWKGSNKDSPGFTLGDRFILIDGEKWKIEDWLIHTGQFDKLEQLKRNK